MAASNVNVVVITGNLTQDPELRSTGGGTSVCEMRVAVNSRRKDGQSGQWVDKPNYFNVVVFGAQADNCATYLPRGRPVAVEGRLDWREWEAKDGSGKRQAVQIIANTVQFLGSRDGGGGPERQRRRRRRRQQQPYSAPPSDVPADESDFGAVRPAAAAGRRHPILSLRERACALPIAPLATRSVGAKTLDRAPICSLRRRLCLEEQERVHRPEAPAVAAAVAPSAPVPANTRGSTPKSSTTRI